MSYQEAVQPPGEPELSETLRTSRSRHALAARPYAKSCGMRHVDVDFSPRAVSGAAQLVRAYTDSVDGNVAAELSVILDDVGGDEAQLRNLLASIAGLAGHAVMLIAARLEADAGPDDNPERRLQALSERREEVLLECARALREFRPASLHIPRASSDAAMGGIWERRSGSDRRVGTDRRRQPSGSSSEKINLRLFGERRVGVVDRRRGTDRRRVADVAPA